MFQNQSEFGQSIQAGNLQSDMEMVFELYNGLPPSVRRMIQMPSLDDLRAMGLNVQIFDGLRVGSIKWWEREVAGAEPDSPQQKWLASMQRAAERARAEQNNPSG